MANHKILYSTHPWICALRNVLLVMGIFTLMRLFYFWVNHDLFQDVTFSHLLEMMLGGLRFDLTAVLYLNSVYLLLSLLPLPAGVRNHKAYIWTKRLFFFLPNLVGVVLNSGDTIYTRFSDRRTTVDVFTEFGNDSNLGGIFLESIVQYWYVTLVALLLIAALWFFYSKPKTERPNPDIKSQLHYYGFNLCLMLVTAYFVVIGIRGGFGAFTRPITMSNAMQYTNRAAEANIVLNTPFSIFRSIGNEVYEDPKYFSEQEMTAIMTPEHPALAADSIQQQQMNVVVLILESCCKEHWGFYNRHLDNGTYKGFTPFLDSIAANGVTYDLSYASGRKSIDAMPSVLSSIPMLITPYVLTSYSTNQVSGLADVLCQEGYSSAFFHNAPNGSMGFLGYSKSCGFQQYFGKTEYNNDADYDGNWGIWDEPFLQFFCHTMSGLKQPFVAAEFTTSSHHPFNVPQQYEGKLPEGKMPLCRCIAYTDRALQHFFHEAQKQPWYKNTLFVLTADHTNQLYHDEYMNDFGLYSVPIVFYAPGHLQPRMDSTTVISQTDIMPSVLAYLGYKKPFFAFGEDALTRAKTHNYAVCYNNPYFQIFSQHGLLQFDGQKVVSVQGDIPKAEQEDMLRYLKAYIQQYIERMVENRLTTGQSTVK